MTLEEYNLLDADFAHCSGEHCERANECLRHTAHEMLAKNTRESYTVVNPVVITGRQPCSLFMPDRKERYAWGISRIYDNVRAADLRGVRWASCNASARLPITMSRSNSAPSPRKSNRTSAKPLPKGDTTAKASSSTAMKNITLHSCV